MRQGKWKSIKQKIYDSLGNGTNQSTTQGDTLFSLFGQQNEKFFIYSILTRLEKQHTCLLEDRPIVLPFWKAFYKSYRIFNSYIFWPQNTISEDIYLRTHTCTYRQGYSVQRIYTRMFIIALLITAKDWSHLSCHQ